MSKRNHKAIFERFIEPDSQTSGAKGEWEEVCKEWVSLEPVALFAQRQEFIEAAQVTGQRKSKVTVTHSPTMATVTTDCRMKIAKPIPVNESDSNDDANFRIFQIEQIVNVHEGNRELEMMVQEQT